MQVCSREGSISSQAWDEIHDNLVLALDLVSSGPRDAMAIRNLVSHLEPASEAAKSCLSATRSSVTDSGPTF